jgi:hypothetical protein
LAGSITKHQTPPKEHKTSVRDRRARGELFPVMSALPAARHYFRGDDGYEAARRDTGWNQRVPERYNSFGND